MAGVSIGIGDTGSSSLPMGGGGDAELGALLGEGFDLAAGDGGDTGGSEAPPGEGGGFGDSQPFEAPSETPGGEEGGLSVAAPDAGAAPATDSPWKLAADGQSYVMPKGDLPRVQNALKFSEAVGQIFANPMEAQSAALQASDMRTMFNDWNYGTDESLRSVMNHLAGANHQDPATRQAYQRSFTKMAQMAPEMLKNINPQAYSQFVSNVGKQLTSQLYEKAAQTGNPQDLLDAQAHDWSLTGQYQKELPRQDPAAQAQTQFQRERQEFQARQDAAYKRDVIAFNGTAVEGAKMGQLSSRIDALLAPVKAKFNDVAYADLKAGIQREAMDTLMRNEWFTEHKQNFDQLMSDYRHTWNQGSPGQGLQPRVQSYINDFLSRASRVLPAIAQKRVNATTQARLGQTKPGPKPGTARPSPAPSNGQPAARLTSEQWDEEFAKALRV